MGHVIIHGGMACHYCENDAESELEQQITQKAPAPQYASHGRMRCKDRAACLDREFAKLERFIGKPLRRDVA